MQLCVKPEYARILLGCANVDKIPPSAEGVLGDDFYDFFYDIEKIVVGPPNKEKVAVSSGSEKNLSAKRMRTENTTITPASPSATGSVNVGFQSDGGKQMHRNLSTLPVVEESSSDDFSGRGEELLIEQIARENASIGGGLSQGSCSSGSKVMVGICAVPPVPHMDPLMHEKLLSADMSVAASYVYAPTTPKCNQKLDDTVWQGPDTPESTWVVPCVTAPATPAVQSEWKMADGIDLKLGSKTHLSYTGWPSLPVVVEMDNTAPGVMSKGQVFYVEPPVSPPLPNNSVELESHARYGVSPGRNVAAKMKKVQDLASELTRKRNLEGTKSSPTSNSFTALSDSDIVSRAFLMGVIIPDNDFETINILREMEAARNKLAEKNYTTVAEKMKLNVSDGDVIPLCLTWSDVKDNIEEPVVVAEKS